MGILGSTGSKMATRQRKALYGLLGCLALYVGFHLIRPSIPLSLFRDSFPSLLLGAAMTISVGIIPGIKFNSFRSQSLVTLSAVAFSALWFEAIVPKIVDQTTIRSTGSFGDFMAMIVGSLLILVCNQVVSNSANRQVDQSICASKSL